MSSPDKFVVYLRVSTQRQGASGLGLEAQRQAVQAHVANVGGRIVGEFVEVESGTDDDRPELARALSVASRSKAFILVAKCDRLARDVALVSAVMKGSEGLVDASNPTASTLELHLRACIAEEEARLVSARMSAALQVAKARGAKLGGMPYGWNRIKDRVDADGRCICEPNVEERRIVERIVELRREGLTLRAIADQLTDEGYPTKLGGQWAPKTVLYILRRAGVA